MFRPRFDRFAPVQWRESLHGLAGVLVTPGLAPAALASLFARLPKGTIPLALVLVARSESGSLAVAGIAVGLFAVGDAISAPLLGRALDRLGRTRTLLGCTCAHVAAVSVAFFGRGHPVLFCLAAAIAGFALPPIGGAAKAAWAQLLPPDRHHAGYTLESLLQQSFFFVGPLLVSAVIKIGGTVTAGLGIGQVLISAGVVGFVITTRRLGRGQTPQGVRGRSDRQVLGNRTVLAMSLVTMAEGIGFGAFGVCVVALTARVGSPTSAGVLQSLLTTGGLLAVFSASKPIDRRRLFLLLSGFALIGLVLAALAFLRAPLVIIGIVLILQGVFLTPIAAGSYRLVAAVTSTGTRAEAFGWLSTALAIGNAGGAAAGGWAAEHADPGLGLLLGPVAILAVVLGYRRAQEPMII